MKRILFILAMVLSITSCNGGKSKDNYKDEDFSQYQVVYICTGTHATKYHIDKNCKSLSNCKGRVVEMTKGEAVKRHRTPCKLCN